MAERLAPGVWYLDLGWPAPLGSNAYIVDDGEVTLVDAGLPVNGKRIRGEIGAAGFEAGEIDRVLLTHYDLDHFGGLSRLVPDLDAPVYMGERDLALLTGGWDPPLAHHKGLFHRGLRALYSVPGSLSFRAVEDGDRIGGFEAYHTPGHNPGHVAYVHGERSAASLGDLVWESGGRLTTPFWLDSYDMRELRRSIHRFVERAPDFETACVGHGSPMARGGMAALRVLASEW